MAGIWDRIQPGISDRVPSHLLSAALSLGATGTFSDAAIRNALNAKIGTPLSAAAETDLVNIRAQAAGTSAAKAHYKDDMDALFIAVECGALTNEATFRTKLNIPNP